MSYLVMEVRNSFSDEWSNDLGNLPIPSHFRFHIHFQLVKRVGVIGHESTESLLKSESEVSIDKIGDSESGSVHF